MSRFLQWFFRRLSTVQVQIAVGLIGFVVFALTDELHQYYRLLLLESKRSHRLLYSMALVPVLVFSAMLWLSAMKSLRARVAQQEEPNAQAQHQRFPGFVVSAVIAAALA